MLADTEVSLCTVHRVILVLLAAAVLNACAIGNVGTLAAKVEQTGKVTTVDMYSVGLHLRTRFDDLGTHLGYSHRRYVYVSESTLEPGWYIFKAPLPDREAVAQDLMTVGIELSTVAPVAGVTFGFSHNKLHARVPIDESVYIQYDRNNTRVVKVEYCNEEEPCEIITPLR